MKRAAWMMSIAIVAVYGPTSVGAQEVAELPAEDRRLRAVTEGVYEVGGIDAPEWAAFADVDAVEFDGRGRLYVLDSRSHRVVVVGPEGGRVREVGREGEGPGEFRAPRDLAVTPEGDVVVVDVLRRRLSHFGVDGELVADVPADLGDGMPRSIFPHPYGGVVGDAIVYLSTGEPRVRMGDRYRSIDHRPIQRYVIEGDGDVEVLHGARLAPPPVDERGRPYLTAFFPDFHWTALPDGRAVLSDTAAYLLTVVGSEGGVERRLRRPLAGRRVTAELRDRERERLLDELAAGNPPESTFGMGPRPSAEEMERRFRSRIEQMRFPEVLPQIRGVVSDPEGRIWVERSGRDPYEPGPIDIVTADGGYSGTLPAGDRGMPAALGPDGLAAFVTYDELDVPTIHVVRLRLTEG